MVNHQFHINAPLFLHILKVTGTINTSITKCTESYELSFVKKEMIQKCFMFSDTTYTI